MAKISILSKPISTYRCSRGAVADIEHKEKSDAMCALLIEIKLSINRRLFECGHITEEMYSKAKELIVRQSALTQSS